MGRRGKLEVQNDPGSAPAVQTATLNREHTVLLQLQAQAPRGQLIPLLPVCARLIEQTTGVPQTSISPVRRPP